MSAVIPSEPSAAVAPHGLALFSPHHLKNAIANLLPASVVVAGSPAAGAVVGYHLVGGGIMVLASIEPRTMFRHQQQHLEHLPVDDVNVMIGLEGHCTIEAGGVDFVLGTGDVMFMPARTPTTFHTDVACRMLVLRLSFSRFCNGQHSKFSDFQTALALRASPLRQAVWNYVHDVLPALGQSVLATVAHAEQAFISLLAAMYTEVRHASRAPEPAGHGRWDQLLLAMAAMLGDPDLSVASLAAALGLSTRRVHRLFAQHGLRYGAYLLEQRLERARAELGRPMHAALTVAEIGYRAGFNGASHFSRCFRLRYGVSPSAYRSVAVT